jgi:hypothetical protein
MDDPSGTMIEPSWQARDCPEALYGCVLLDTGVAPVTVTVGAGATGDTDPDGHGDTDPDGDADAGTEGDADAGTEGDD